MFNSATFLSVIRVAILFFIMGWCFGASASITPDASDYYESPQINAGEKIVLEIAFNEYPISSVGSANGLVLNFGGLNTANEMTNLYIAGNLVGSTSSYPTPQAVFQSSLSPKYYSGHYVESLALDSVFNGLCCINRRGGTASGTHVA